MSQIAENIQEIRVRMEQAADRSGRDPSCIRLIGVCKRQPLSRVFQAYDCGLRDFAENTVQGLFEKVENFRATGRKACWHFIGHIQRNKVNKLLGQIDMIHTIDRPELVQALVSRISDGNGVDVLIQVNIGREKQKKGINSNDVIPLAKLILSQNCPLRLRGLMAIPPFHDDPRPYFQEMKQLLQSLQHIHSQATELSMGMSSDFETAIDMGATLVRVGTAIFGDRLPKE